MRVRLFALAAATLLLSAVGAFAGSISNYPPASQPLGTVFDAVPMDQGAGCPFGQLPCQTVQSPSLRIGQPIQTNCLSVVAPFAYQLCIDTSVNPAVEKQYIGTTWWALYTLDPSVGPISGLIAPGVTSPFTVGGVSVTTTGAQLNYLNIATGTLGTGAVVFSSALTGPQTPVIVTAASGSFPIPDGQNMTVWKPPAAIGKATFTLPATPTIGEADYTLTNDQSTPGYSVILAANAGQSIDPGAQAALVMVNPGDTIRVHYIGSNTWITR